MDDDPPGLQIESVEHPVAYAYTALMRWLRGDEAGSQRALHRLPYKVAEIARVLPDPQDSHLTRLITFVAESQVFFLSNCRMPGGPGRETWCGMFDKYPLEALSAYKIQASMGVDGYLGEQKHHCLMRILRVRGSAKLVRDFEAATSRIPRALEAFTGVPVGTEWPALMGTIGDVLYEPLFGASRIERPDPQTFKKDLDDAGGYICDIQTRLAHYRQMETRIAPTLASAYCKMAEHQGRAPTLDECHTNAMARLESALQLWLEEGPYATMQYDRKGNVFAPKECP